MFNQQQQQQLQQLQQQQLQQQQLQQQQLLQLQQLLQQSPPQAPLPMTVSRGLPAQQPQQPLLNLQGTNSASLLNGSMLQRALLLQQLQGHSPVLAGTSSCWGPHEPLPVQPFRTEHPETGPDLLLYHP